MIDEKTIKKLGLSSSKHGIGTFEMDMGIHRDVDILKEDFEKIVGHIRKYVYEQKNLKPGEELTLDDAQFPDEVEAVLAVGDYLIKAYEVIAPYIKWEK